MTFSEKKPFIYKLAVILPLVCWSPRWSRHMDHQQCYHWMFSVAWHVLAAVHRTWRDISGSCWPGSAGCQRSRYRGRGVDTAVWECHATHTCRWHTPSRCHRRHHCHAANVIQHNYQVNTSLWYNAISTTLTVTISASITGAQYDRKHDREN